MTDVWMLSKESMKGMDLLAVTTDVLYVLEQKKTMERELPSEELEKFEKGCALLNILASTAKGQISRGQQKDLFMLRVVEFLEKTLGLQPSKLAERLDIAQGKLKEGYVTSEVTELFEQISEAVMDMTSRSVDAVSTSLR